MAASKRVRLDLSTTVCNLNCSVAFQELTNTEKLYAHFLAKASWQGSLIVFLQTSPESPVIFLLFQSLYSGQSISQLKADSLAITEGQVPTPTDFHALLVYSAAFYSNMGNYKSFGDTKFAPSISPEKLYAIIQVSNAYKQNPDRMDNLWNLCKDRMYSVQSRVLELGLGAQGLSTYYSSNCSTSDADFVKEFMQHKDISPYNTRLFKYENNSKVQYEIKIASVEESGEAYQDSEGKEDTVAKLLGKHEYKGCEILITRGDYAPLLKRLVENLRIAKRYASNENEVSMLEEYCHSFTTGSIESHKNGSRFWIKNKGPIIEFYIGFIETYRDPFGIRGEFEGFVAVVNKPMSAKFSRLVNSAESLLDGLPWPKAFEKDTFLRPDFTSLDILGFSGSGIPAGINIPNYDDIRQTEGFKNVSLGNVLSSYGSNKAVTFLSEKDQELYKELRGPAFEVQVGLHELLGHGSGKLFSQLENGSCDFDRDIVNPLTGKKIDKWYNPGETYDSKFVSMGSSYEECRAECVGLYLCLSNDVLRIFGHDGEGAENIKYVNWLLMVRGGLLGLEFFTPETNSWKQAHMQARFVIMRVLIDAEVVTISEITGEDGKPDLLISLDRDRIAVEGKEAIGKFLCKLQIYKATGDYEAARSMYQHYSTVSEGPILKLITFRNIVLERKQPRHMLVQCHTSDKGDGEVDLTEYESSVEGMISSFIDRFPGYDKDLFNLWEKEIENHNY